MKTSLINVRRVCVVIAALALCGALNQQQTRASGSGSGGGTGGKSSSTTTTTTTSTLPADAGGLVKSGGGGTTKSGGGSVSTTKTTTTTTSGTTVAPAPAPAINTGTLTFSAAGPVNGVDPLCSGDWRIDPYYPTLLDMTVNVHVSSLNVPDGTQLYIAVAGSQAVYPFTSNVISIVGGAGSCSEQIFIYPGTTFTGVIISDASGNILFAGN